MHQTACHRILEAPPLGGYRGDRLVRRDTFEHAEIAKTEEPHAVDRVTRPSIILRLWAHFVRQIWQLSDPLPDPICGLLTLIGIWISGEERTVCGDRQTPPRPSTYRKRSS